jgi:hypothetical protein
MGNAMPLGQVRLARLDEFEIAGRRRDVSFAEFVMNDDASVGQVADHGHVALLALVGELGGFLFGNDLAGIAIQRVPSDTGLPNPRGDDALVDATQARQSSFFTASPAFAVNNSSVASSLSGSTVCAKVPIIPPPFVTRLASVSITSTLSDRPWAGDFTSHAISIAELGLT